VTEDSARALIATQMPQERKAALGHVRLRNDGTVADLTATVDALWPLLSAL